MPVGYRQGSPMLPAETSSMTAAAGFWRKSVARGIASCQKRRSSGTPDAMILATLESALAVFESDVVYVGIANPISVATSCRMLGSFVPGTEQKDRST